VEGRPATLSGRVEEARAGSVAERVGGRDAYSTPEPRTAGRQANHRRQRGLDSSQEGRIVHMTRGGRVMGEGSHGVWRDEDVLSSVSLWQAPDTDSV
jgi:hypothetical protein